MGREPWARPRSPGKGATPLTPLLQAKAYAAPSVFRPENLLREARRQKALSAGDVPEVCVLDPDGDVVRELAATGRARRSPHWACYHTDLHVADHGAERFGIVGGAVGAAFAVLVAEQLFVSGCRLLLSVTSAGQIATGRLPSFVLIDRALRDEGTSHHYLPPSMFAAADPALVDPVLDAMATGGLSLPRGASWTTDAPFRETGSAIEAARGHGALVVEMEAAALYAFAAAPSAAQSRAVLCFAHVTNQMAQTTDSDFEKGEANGAHAALDLLTAAMRAWRSLQS